MTFDLSYLLGSAGNGLGAGLQTMPMLLSLAGYVLTALAFCAMAQKRNVKYGWLSWVPVGNSFLLGSFSDQYQYVVKKRVTSRRTVLLILSILSAVFTTVILFIGFSSFFEIIKDAVFGLSDRQLEKRVLSTVTSVLGLLIIMLPLTIARLVLRYMALYDIFRSCDPETSVMFLVIGIFFPVTTPFFLFFNREKEKGMPPRKPSAPVPTQKENGNGSVPPVLEEAAQSAPGKAAEYL